MTDTTWTELDIWPDTGFCGEVARRIWPPWPRPAGRADIERREALLPTGTQMEDVAVLPGDAATAVRIHYETKRKALLRLVQRFGEEGFSWNAGNAIPLPAATVDAATAFLRILPDRAILPKLSPDSDGCLTLVWEGHGDTILVVVEGSMLHLVQAPATPNTQYADDVYFDGSKIPAVIRSAIPNATRESP